MRKVILGSAVAALLAVSPVRAQWAVIDAANLQQSIQQLVQMQQQFQVMQQQFQQMQSMHNSFNQLTNMGQVAGLLNQQGIRNALPTDVSSLQAALKGSGSGADTFHSSNHVYSSGDPLYQGVMDQRERRNAGQASVATQMYDAASKRLAGILQLQDQISMAESPKQIADLQARIQVEQVAAQQDMIRMQAVQTIAQAQQQADLAAAEQASRKWHEDRIRARQALP